MARGGREEERRQRPSRTAIEMQLNEIGPMRIATMDEAGIDVQVLGHGMPSTQRMDAESAVRLARISNDYVAEKCKAYPTRLFGFANLPTPDPEGPDSL